MTLDSLLSSNRDNFVTSVTPCNVGDVTRKPACIKDVTPVTSQNINSQIEIIENWLFSIGEPEEGYHLVLDKCRNDPEAMAYFLKYASGEFEPGCSVTDELKTL